MIVQPADSVPGSTPFQTTKKLSRNSYWILYSLKIAGNWTIPTLNGKLWNTYRSKWVISCDCPLLDALKKGILDFPMTFILHRKGNLQRIECLSLRCSCRAMRTWVKPRYLKIVPTWIDWFKGKFTGKSHIWWENLWFPEIYYPLKFNRLLWKPWLSPISMICPASLHQVVTLKWAKCYRLVDSTPLNNMSLRIWFMIIPKYTKKNI